MMVGDGSIFTTHLNGKTNNEIPLITIYFRHKWPFYDFKKIYIDFGYSKLAKYYTIFSLIFNIFVFVLEIYYLFSYFSLELLTRYGTFLVIMSYVSGLFSKIIIFLLIVYSCNGFLYNFGRRYLWRL